MLRAIHRRSPTIRSTVIIAAGVALILPLPARCMSCSVGEINCAHCQSTHANPSPTAHRSCCEQHAIASHQSASTGRCSSQLQSKTCGCKLQAPDRTYVAADRQIIAPDLVALLPPTQPLLSADASQVTRYDETLGNLPPPVPHRILHCSWII